MSMIHQNLLIVQDVLSPSSNISKFKRPILTASGILVTIFGLVPALYREKWSWYSISSFHPHYTLPSSFLCSFHVHSSVQSIRPDTLFISSGSILYTRCSSACSLLSLLRCWSAVERVVQQGCFENMCPCDMDTDIIVYTVQNDPKYPKPSISFGTKYFKYGLDMVLL